MIKRILAILSRKERRKLIGLFAAILVMALLEVVGVASILPFMQLAADPEAVSKNRWLFDLYEAAGFTTFRSMLISTGATVLLFITLANSFAILTIWLQQKYAWRVAHELCARLLRTYLNRPYSYFLRKNTAELFSNLIIEVTQFSIGVLIPFLDLLARAMVTLVIFVLLLFVDPLIAIIVSGGLGLCYLSIYMLRKTSLQKLGGDRVEANLQRFKSMNEALTSIKTSRVFGAQDFFFHRFEKASDKHSRIQPIVQLISVAPKYIIEILAFGGILAVMLYLLIRGENLQTTLPLLSIYALAGYRLLPALQKGFAAAANLRHSFPVVGKLEKDLQSAEQEALIAASKDAVPILQKSVRLKGIKFFYEGESLPVLSNIDLTIHKGQTVAFVGETGSGKTTLVDLLTGLLYPQSGAIYIDDVVMQPSNAASWHRQIGYVPQDVFLFDDTVKRNIAIGLEDAEIDMRRLEWAAQTANIHSFITQELPKGFETTIGERGVRLSGGQRQRLGLARALYRQPGILILDEATSALDSITEHAVIDSLKAAAGSLTVVIVAHRLSTVRHADCIYVLERGKIIQEGPYETLLKTSDVFREMAQLSDTN